MLADIPVEVARNINPHLLLPKELVVHITKEDVQPYDSICKQDAYKYLIDKKYYVQAYDFKVPKESHDNSQACVRKKNGWFVDMRDASQWKDRKNTSLRDTATLAFIYNSQGKHISMDEMLKGETMIFVVGTHSSIEGMDMDASYESLIELDGVHIVTFSSTGGITVVTNKERLEERFAFEKHGHLFVYGICNFYVACLHHDPAIDLYDANNSDYIMYTDESARPLRLGVIIAMWGYIVKMLKGVQAKEAAKEAAQQKAQQKTPKKTPGATPMETPKKVPATPKAMAAKRALKL